MDTHLLDLSKDVCGRTQHSFVGSIRRAIALAQTTTIKSRKSMFVSSNMEVLFNYLLGLVKTMNKKKTERVSERRSERTRYEMSVYAHVHTSAC